jgi:hypothetical protein
LPVDRVAHYLFISFELLTIILGWPRASPLSRTGDLLNPTPAGPSGGQRSRKPPQPVARGLAPSRILFPPVSFLFLPAKCRKQAESAVSAGGDVSKIVLFQCLPRKIYLSEQQEANRTIIQA